MNYYKLVYKFQSLVRLLEIIYQIIWNYQKLSKIAKSGEFLGRLVEFLGPLLKIVSSLMSDLFKPLAKSVLIPLG